MDFKDAVKAVKLMKDDSHAKEYFDKIDAYVSSHYSNAKWELYEAGVIRVYHANDYHNTITTIKTSKILNDSVRDADENMIDFLIRDEEEAVKGYEKAIEQARQAGHLNALDVYSHILNEELEHIKELKELRSDDIHDCIKDEVKQFKVEYEYEYDYKNSNTYSDVMIVPAENEKEAKDMVDRYCDEHGLVMTYVKSVKQL